MRTIALVVVLSGFVVPWGPACTPAQDATVERDLAAMLGAERYACVAANFLPGVAKGDVLVACTIADELTGAAYDLMGRIEAKRSDAGAQ